MAARTGAELFKVAAEAGVDCKVVECDLSSLTGRDALFAACPERIAGLVNNAGFGTAGPFAEQDRTRERMLVDLNCAAVVNLCHLFLPRLSAVHGLKNSLFVFSNRFSPRTLSAKVAKKIMEPWIKHRSA